MSTDRDPSSVVKEKRQSSTIDFTKKEVILHYSSTRIVDSDLHAEYFKKKLVERCGWIVIHPSLLAASGP